MCCNCCTDKWTCCCCCHVTKGAHVLAWICLAIGILFLPILLLFLSASLFLFFCGVLTVIPYFTGVPIIFGELRGKRSRQMYLPFLIIFGFGLVYTFFYAGADIMVKMNEISSSSSSSNNTTTNSSAAAQMNRTTKKLHDNELSKTTLQMIEIGSYFVIWILVLALNVWLYSIVLRAYFFVKNNNEHCLNGGAANRKIEHIAL